MPEVELRKDPLGANRGKTLLEQAVDLSSQVKKQIHDKYYTPPYIPSNRHWEMTFASLGFTRKTIEKFWRLFCQINNCTDTIRLEHFLEYFDLDWTSWNERCFSIFDTTGSGDVDFLEFMITVWNICTFKIDSLSNFTFDMFDLDADGELSLPEIELMVEELYGGGGAGKQCLQEITEFAEARGGALNLNSFIAFTANHQSLLFPVFLLQRNIQQHVFGVGYWETVERSSKEDDSNVPNTNKFDPRHVQVLMRTYQDGGAAAVLNHTGDLNKGVELPLDIEEDAEKGSKMTGLQRLRFPQESQIWNSVRKSVVDGGVLGKLGIERMKEFKGSNGIPRGDGREGYVNGEGTERPPPSQLPVRVALDEQRSNAPESNAANEHRKTDTKGQGNPDPARIPRNVADDLRRIRERRNQITPQLNRGPRKSIAPPNNIRQRTAGSIIFKSNDQHGGWLEK